MVKLAVVVMVVIVFVMVVVVVVVAMVEVDSWQWFSLVADVGRLKNHLLATRPLLDSLCMFTAHCRFTILKFATMLAISLVAITPSCGNVR